MSDNKIDDVDLHYLDGTCNQEAMITDGTVYEMNKAYYDNTIDIGLIQIGVNSTAVVDPLEEVLT